MADPPGSAVATAAPQARLLYLDGLRGLAIALVMLYHAYARWPDQVPFGHRYENVPGLAQGKLGVELFFLISGFVIFMTLDRSCGVREFMARRWFRLFPAMLGVSLLVYLSAPLFARPQGAPTLRDLLPGLTFVEPRAWETVFGSPQGVLEGSFWSLYVEVKFYAIISAVYFWRGPRAAICILTLVYVVPMVDRGLPVFVPLNEIAAMLDAKYWGWFIAGSIYHLSHKHGSRWLFAAALGVSLVAALNSGYSKAAVALALLFCATQCLPLARRFFEARIWVFLGAVSYPLYLVHENMMIGMISSVGHVAPGLAGWLMPIMPMAVVVGIAWIFARWIEPSLRTFVHPAYIFLRASHAPVGDRCSRRNGPI